MDFAGSDAGVPISLNTWDAFHFVGNAGRRIVTCIDDLCSVTIGPFRHLLGRGVEMVWRDAPTCCLTPTSQSQDLF